MRAGTGLGEPPESVNAFPAVTLSKANTLFRSVKKGRTPWWFGSDGAQRFDLAEPLGTCYLANDLETAIRERGRDRLLSTGSLDVGFLNEMEVYVLRLPDQVQAANTADAAAVRFGVNREVSTITDYGLSGRWAACFAYSGFGGLTYASRCTSDPQWNAVALFGAAGDAHWPIERKLSGIEAAALAGIGEIIDGLPRARQFVLSRPPSAS